MRNQSDVFWPKEENVNIPNNLDPIRFISTAPQGRALDAQGSLRVMFSKMEMTETDLKRFYVKKDFI